jgi:hypothetical protein
LLQEESHIPQAGVTMSYYAYNFFFHKSSYKKGAIIVIFIDYVKVTAVLGQGRRIADMEVKTDGDDLGI